MTQIRLQQAELPEKWVKVIDQNVCIGCHACSTACKSENQVPLSVNRTYVKAVDVGVFPDAHRAFQVTRCNQCEDPPCATVCPTAAMFQRPDGIVDFDKSICIGCKACIAACPYDAVFMNPEDHSAEKCNFCAHRLDLGLEPACVVVCPTEAIMVGNHNDPSSRVAQVIGREPVTVRRPEKDTRPKLYYLGATQATLDPLAAQRPPGNLFMWSEQKSGGDYVVSGDPGPANNSAAAMLAYDVPHRMPWDWRVSGYTWTKGIGAGSYLVAALAVVLGLLEPSSVLWQWAAPLLSLGFMGLTGALLIWDLEHPGRFYYIFTKAHKSSWLVKGGYIIAAYSAVLSGHLIGSLTGNHPLQMALVAAGVPLAVMTAVYTAYLFAQARARDLWQSPLLPPHLAVQALVAGSAALSVVSAILPVPGAVVLAWVWTLSASSLAHLLMVVGEVTLTHPTAHARRAVQAMTSGRFAFFFRGGFLLLLVGAAAPWLMVAVPSSVFAVPLLALLGLLLHEHAYVQAGQSVPLA